MRKGTGSSYKLLLWRGRGAHDTGQVSCIKSDEIVSYEYMVKRCFPTKDCLFEERVCFDVEKERRWRDGERDTANL